MTEKEILELTPEFKFGNMIMRDYFLITKGGSFYCIRSGLNHCNKNIKSPFHYDKCIGGDNSEKRSLEEFTKWWATLE